MAQKHIGLKLFSVLLSLSLLMAAVAGGTYAWLIAESEVVVNTFTYGDINITLTETDTDLDGDGEVTTNDYKMIPGGTITKDPIVTVKQGSEACWLFVKLEESENFGDFMEYTMANDGQTDVWTELDADEGIYFRTVTADEVSAGDKEFSVLHDDTVTVKAEVTKEMLNDLDADPENAAYPTLTITAYAVQYAGFEPVDGKGDPIAEPTEDDLKLAATAAWEAVSAETPANP